MARILLICPRYTPNSSVSVLRNSFFGERLSRQHDVDIWSADLNESVVSDVDLTIPSNLVNSFSNVLLNRGKIKLFVEENNKNYDLVIISVPQYTLLSFVKPFVELGVKVVCDVRDLPDLIYYHYKKRNPYLIPVRFLMNYFVEKYLINSCNAASFNICVGDVSESILISKGVGTIKSVHNGFRIDDLRSFTDIEILKNHSSEAIKIGLGGNIHDFRDSKYLRGFLTKIDELSKNISIELHHFGIFSDKLLAFVNTLHNIKYIPYMRQERDEYLEEISKVDVVLLITSDCLSWEPTTTVFDYLVLDKPVLFVGAALEAESILVKSGVHFLNTNLADISEIKAFIFSRKCKSRPELHSFSREHQFTIFEQLLMKHDAFN